MGKYYVNLFHDTIYKVNVLEEVEDGGRRYVYFKYIDLLDDNGNVVAKDIYINRNTKFKIPITKECGPFDTVEEAITEITSFRENERNKWWAKITDVKHLLELPFQTIMMEDGGNWVDEAAIYVYKEKCKELLGVDIDVTQYSWENEDE